MASPHRYRDKGQHLTACDRMLSSTRSPQTASSSISKATRSSLSAAVHSCDGITSLSTSFNVYHRSVSRCGMEREQKTEKVRVAPDAERRRKVGARRSCSVGEHVARLWGYGCLFSDTLVRIFCRGCGSLGRAVKRKSAAATAMLGEQQRSGCDATRDCS